MFVPMQKHVARTLDFQAHREFKSIVILLTQLGIPIPFLHTRYSGCRVIEASATGSLSSVSTRFT